MYRKEISTYNDLKWPSFTQDFPVPPSFCCKSNHYTLYVFLNPPPPIHHLNLINGVSFLYYLLLGRRLHLLQHCFNISDHIHRISLGRITFVRFTLVIYQELCEIPSYIQRPILGRQRALQEGIYLARPSAVHVTLREPREFIPGAELTFDEVHYLGIRPRLLSAKLIAGECQYCEFSRIVRIVQLRELRIIGGR